MIRVYKVFKGWDCSVTLGCYALTNTMMMSKGVDEKVVEKSRIKSILVVLETGVHIWRM